MVRPSPHPDAPVPPPPGPSSGLDPDAGGGGWAAVAAILASPAGWLLISTASSVVFVSVLRAIRHDRDAAAAADTDDEAEAPGSAPADEPASVRLSLGQALLAPVAASCTLLLLFFFLPLLGPMLLILAAGGAGAALSFALAPAAAACGPPGRATSGPRPRLLGRGPRGAPATAPGCCAAPSPAALLSTLSYAIVLLWLLSGHWLLNDVLGAAICVSLVSAVRLPDLRTASLLLGALFCYDVFWVFFSAHLFGTNVMVDVATQVTRNPLRWLADLLHLPGAGRIAPSVDLPLKFMFPRALFGPDVAPPAGREFLFLGFGDVALPAMLVVLASGFDRLKPAAQQQPGAAAVAAGAGASGPASAGDASNVEAPREAAEGWKDPERGGPAAGGGGLGADGLDRTPLLQDERGRGVGGSGAGRPGGPGDGCWAGLLASVTGPSYLTGTMIGYTLGLIAALVAGTASQLPQPALMYIVPAILIPVSLKGLARKELPRLWQRAPEEEAGVEASGVALAGGQVAAA